MKPNDLTGCLFKHREDGTLCSVISINVTVISPESGGSFDDKILLEHDGAYLVMSYDKFLNEYKKVGINDE